MRQVAASDEQGGSRRRRLKSKLLWKGSAFPVGQLPSDSLPVFAAAMSPNGAVMSESGHANADLEPEPTMKTRSLDMSSGKPIISIESQSNVLNRGVIPANHTRKIQWDFFLGSMIMYSVVIVPWRFGFLVEPSTP